MLDPERHAAFDVLITDVLEDVWRQKFGAAVATKPYVWKCDEPKITKGGA